MSTSPTRRLILQGAGDKSFVSGADISEFKEKRDTVEAMQASFGTDPAVVVAGAGTTGILNGGFSPRVKSSVVPSTNTTRNDRTCRRVAP